MQLKEKVKMKWKYGKKRQIRQGKLQYNNMSHNNFSFRADKVPISTRTKKQSPDASQMRNIRQTIYRKLEAEKFEDEDLVKLYKKVYNKSEKAIARDNKSHKNLNLDFNKTSQNNAVRIHKQLASKKP